MLEDEQDYILTLQTDIPIFILMLRSSINSQISFTVHESSMVAGFLELWGWETAAFEILLYFPRNFLVPMPLGGSRGWRRSLPSLQYSLLSKYYSNNNKYIPLYFHYTLIFFIMMSSMKLHSS